MKKIVSYFLSCIIVLTFIYIPVYADVIFNDLTNEHWSYNNIMMLVKDGTVNGFEDGSFRPNDIVTRAEFVKMLGKGSIKRDFDFVDVTKDHWGYDYIMYSGLDGVNNNFNPDHGITRNDVLNLIWKRNGEKRGFVIPSIVAKQSSNYDAVAWGYTYGIMTGDDGLNLRLNDVLSRAEAAALIIRARAINDNSEQKGFSQRVSSDLLKTIVNNLNLFDDNTYNDDKVITNGEMSRAALRLGYEEFDLVYNNVVANSLFENEYSRDLYVVGNECLGKEIINEQFVKKNANIKDTLTALTYNAIKKAHSQVQYGSKDNYYRDAGSISTSMMNIMLTYAKKNGIELYSDGNLYPNKDITMREFACILLQLDDLIGTQSSFKNKFNDEKINKQIYNYPDNYEKYQYILESIPNSVYAVDFSRDNVKSNFVFAREYGYIFTNMLNELKNEIELKSNVKVEFTYYPSMVFENSDEILLRVKCEITNNKDGLTLNKIFVNHSELSTDSTGKSCFVELSTNEALTDIYLSPENVTLRKVLLMVE